MENMKWDENKSTGAGDRNHKHQNEQSEKIISFLHEGWSSGTEIKYEFTALAAGQCRIKKKVAKFHWYLDILNYFTACLEIILEEIKTKKI